MENQNTSHSRLFLSDWIISVSLAIFSYLIFSLSSAQYIYPGESAHLIATWSGLSSSTFTMYPLTKAAFAIFGNALAPLSGALSTVFIYLLLIKAIRAHFTFENISSLAVRVPQIGATIASLFFIFMPAVYSSSTHLEPRIVAVAWALLMATLLIPYSVVKKSVAWLFTIIIGVMCGFGLMDTPHFLLLSPLFVILIWWVSHKRGERGYLASALFLLSFITAFFSFAPSCFGGFNEGLSFLKNQLLFLFKPKYWSLVVLFSVIPFLISFLTIRKVFAIVNKKQHFLFHACITFITIFAVASNVEPSKLMLSYAIQPVVASTFIVFTVGYLLTYWLAQALQKTSTNESTDEYSVSSLSRILFTITLSIFSIVLLISFCFNISSFNRNAGEFADRVAKYILDDLGDRTWFVTDGSLDDHLLLAANREGRELNLICLQRDLDKKYHKELCELVKEKQIGGERNGELVLSASLGVLPFIQDWLEIDPEISKKVAIFTAPDLWYSAKLKPIPELFFFGADETRMADWSRWDEINKILNAPEGWGSYKLSQIDDSLEKTRLNLRRHIGLLANNRGVWLADNGNYDEAYKFFELVLNKIDTDNVSALFNEFELARLGHKKALDKRHELERALKAIADDQARRYRLWALANYYGYVRSPELFIQLGYTWARTGNPGAALTQVNRAIELIPSEQHGLLTTMLASFYANENQTIKSRQMYDSVLEKEATNHDALIGLMRLEIIEGNIDAAMQHLANATKELQDDPRVRTEVALLNMMRGNYKEAKDLLHKVIDENYKNMQAWSLYAATVMQELDATKDAETQEKLTKEMKEVVLPAMEKISDDNGNYYLQTARAFLLLREKEQNRQREARDAFLAASRDRPDVNGLSDIILSLNISLNDKVDAERQARETLRRDRKNPLANYVMGSLALQNGRLDEAETFLRRAVDAPKPAIFAFNDLAETLRRKNDLKGAEQYARQGTTRAPTLYITWETLASIILETNGDLKEAEECIKKACTLATDKNGKLQDVRMLFTLAKIQLATGEKQKAKITLRTINSRANELTPEAKKTLEELRTRAR